MPYLEHHPVDYFPRHLLQDEIADPRLAIRRIFDEELNVVDARKWLDKWLNTLFGEKQVLGRKFIVLLMDLQEALLKLLEAAYLLQLEDPSLHKAVSITVMKGTGLPVPSLYCGLTHKEYTAWDYFPRHLTRKEFTDPYRVFSKLCRYKQLPEWRDTLQNFFSTAVSGARIYECCEDSNVYLTGKYLLKLVEAVHLVNVREA